MGLLNALSRRLNPEVELSRLADELAERCFERVWQRVHQQLPLLPPAEAKGYIRARGTAILRPVVGQVAEQQKLAAERRPLLYSLTADSLIRRVQAHHRTLGATSRHLRVA